MIMCLGVGVGEWLVMSDEWSYVTDVQQHVQQHIHTWHNNTYSYVSQ